MIPSGHSPVSGEWPPTQHGFGAWPLTRHAASREGRNCDGETSFRFSNIIQTFKDTYKDAVKDPCELRCILFLDDYGSEAKDFDGHGYQRFGGNNRYVQGDLSARGLG